MLKTFSEYFKNLIPSAKTSQEVSIYLKKLSPTSVDILKKIIIVGIILLVTRSLVKFLRKLLYGQHKYPISLPINRTLIPTISSLISVFIYVVSVLISLDIFGIISKTTLITLLGSLGLGAGFAIKDLAANCIAGIVLLIERPFRLGDYITCNETAGTVTEISLLTTKLENYDGIYIIVPNNCLWGNPVMNFSRNPLRRVVIPLLISYKDSLDLGFKVLKEVSQFENRFVKDPAPTIVIESLKDEYVEIHLRAWAPSDIYWDVYYETILKVKDHALLKGIALPIEQRDLNITISSFEKNNINKSST